MPAKRKTLLCFLLLMVSAPNVWGTAQAADEISTPDQFKHEFQTVPCKNSERQDAVKTLFEQMGAAASEITVDSHKRVENVMIRRDGIGEGLIVVGAHYDKANNGCGALDNWTRDETLQEWKIAIEDRCVTRNRGFAGVGSPS